MTTETNWTPGVFDVDLEIAVRVKCRGDLVESVEACVRHLLDPKNSLKLTCPGRDDIHMKVLRAGKDPLSRGMVSLLDGPVVEGP